MPNRFIHRPIGLPDLRLSRPADHAEIGVPGRITLITSATGFGKSTLLAAWAQTYPHPIAWFNPIQAMQPPETRPVLDRAILTAVGRPNDPVQPPGEIDPLDWSTQVRTWVEEFGKPVAIVVDGPEYVYGDVGPLQSALRLLVEHQPENLALILVSRNFPFGAAEIARLRGRLDVIDERLLTIPDDVVRELLLERGVEEAHVEELVHFLGGWPAAIRVALNVIGPNTSVADVRQQVNEQGTARFFTNALIDRVEEDLRRALIATSIFEVVTPELGRAIGLNDAEVAALGMAYERGIPLTKRFEGASRAFAVHALFRDELLERLRRESVDAEKNLRVRAADHLLAEGEFAGAIEQLIAAGEMSRALETIRANYTPLLEGGYGVRMRTWFDIAGEQNSPRLDRLRQRIYGAMLDGQIALSESLLGSFESEIHGREVPMGHLAFLHLNRAWLAQSRGDLDASVGYAEAAIAAVEASTDDDPRRGEYLNAAYDHIAQAACFTEQPTESDPRVRLVLTPEQEGRTTLWQDVTHPGLLAHLAAYRGEFKRARAFGERAIAATAQDLHGSALFPWNALVAVAVALRENGEAQEAVDLIDQHARAFDRLPMLAYAIDLLAVRAHALADLGRTAEGTETFARLRQMVDTYGRGWWPFDRLDVHEGRFVLRHGDTARSSQIAERLHRSSAAAVLRLRLDAVRAPRRAQQTLRSLTRHTPSEELTYRLYSALIEPAGSNERDEHLTFALQIAQEHGAFRSIADGGEPVMEMITAHVLRHPTRFGESLLAKYQKVQEIQAQGSGARVSLSARELQILGLLATEAPLSQIARTLYVTQNTLKTHLRNLYRKMDVSDRQMAVQKGRALLLIS